ncbi:unnamed protein product [Blepharisma stoltei]|uniref:Uncharacterized protein n=1 Tax=Blepharisma stoltei TaxID=1481888 RepID=A0AAU9K4Y3_9CILI|nr:unnamed protein product [Blepharisma stoltei]
MDTDQRSTQSHILDLEEKYLPSSDYKFNNFSESTTAISSPIHSSNEIKEDAEIFKLKAQVSEIKNMLEGQEKILRSFKSRIQEAKDENLKMSNLLSSVDLSNLSISDSLSKSYMMRSIDYKIMDHPNISLIHKNNDESFVSSLMGLDSEIQSITDTEVSEESEYSSNESSLGTMTFQNWAFIRSHVLYLHI